MSTSRKKNGSRHRLHDNTGQPKEQAIAQFHCELAEQARNEGDVEEAQRRIEQALACDPDCVRASMIRGDIECAAGDYKKAIIAYRQVERQDSGYLPEVIPNLVHCYQLLGETADLLDYLQTLYEKRGGATVLLSLVDTIEQQRGREVALIYLKQHLHDNPSLRGLARLMEIEVNTGDDGTRDIVLLLKETVAKMLEEKPVYQCYHCGFSGKVLHWHCPGCKRWGTVKPILGLEGE